MAEINSYELSRKWFDWSFENPEKISPNHSAIYFFAIEHCNRLGWRDKFGFPTQMVMDAIGIKKHQTYIKYFNDLVEWGFFELVQKSLNQYSANIISLKSAKPKSGKALDKAIITHKAKQIASIGQSNSSIDKPINQLTNKPNNIEQRKLEFSETLKPFLTIYGKDMLNDFYGYWTEPTLSGNKFKKELQTTWDTKRRLETWSKNNFGNKQFGNTEPVKQLKPTRTFEK
jgi:hypothetical protein